ncbi:beta strand repeat-containing protein, partial [Sphingobacterium spiritivorum]|uniref:beta strand repeat-containing protein n=5 Tax=Sphingobacterium spiritivorum TaxID=258 RepID=UPI003DA4527E
IKNTAIVTDPIDPTVPVTPEVEVPTEGKITSVKSIVGNPTKVKSGDELEYRIVLTNSYGTVKTGVTVSDALVAELNAPTAISNNGQLTGNTINWTNLTVPANGTLTLSFKAVVKANLPTGTTAIKNTAIVTDPIDPTVPVTPEVEVPTEGKITSVKSIVGNPTSVKSGDELEYRIVLTNSYGTAKTGVTVSDALAAELNAPTAISNNGQLTGNTINWTNLTVPANGTLTLSFKAVVKANLPTGTTAIKNTAIVTDPIDPTVPVTPEVEVPTEGKITSVKSIVGNPTSVKSGDELEYRIVLTNSYGTVKTGVTVSDALAAELNAPTAISNGGSLSGNTINWTNLTVPANGTLTLNFKAVVKANLPTGTTAIKNTAIVTDPIDPTVPVTPEVEVPTEGKITSVKSIVGNPTSVKSGDELEYRIVLTNSYGTAKTGVTVSDALAAELNAPTAISNNGQLTGNTINWTNLTVPANGTLTLSFKAVVKANLAAGTVSIKNTAIVTDPIDPTVPVTPEVEVPTEGKITSVKSIVGNPTKVKSGDELEYRIVLTNSYGTAKTGVTVSDALAAELNTPTAISNGGSLSGNTINWTNLTVPANGTLTLSFKAVVKANLAAGTVSIKNTAIVTDPIDPTVPVTPEVEVPTEGKITSVKSIVGNPTKVKSGDELEYRIVLTNSYGTAKTGVTVSDALAAELNAPTAISNNGQLTGNTINWTNLTVPANGTLTLSFKAVVKANLAAGTVSIKNIAIVTDPIDPTVPVTPEVEVPTEGKITSVKSIVGNPTKVKSGDELEYHIVLTNSYGTAKTGVTVSDALAAELNAPTAISNNGQLTGNTINWTNLTVPANGTLTLSFKAVVKANLAAGTVSIKNTAIVTDPIDPTVPVTPEVEVPTEGKITSVKSIVGNPTSVKSGDELEYRIVLTNSYGTAKTGVTVSDALAAELNAPTAISNNGQLTGNTINWTNLTVPANGTLTLSFKAVVKANLPTGTTAIKNTAIVTDPIDPSVPVTPEVEVKVPSIALVKESVLNDENGDQTVQKGETITYTFKVVNNGGTIVNNLVVNDTKLNIVNLTVIPSLLNPGETGIATASYTLTQADIDAGNVTNTALAKGTDPRGRDVTDISGTAVDNNTPTVTVLPKQPSLILHKTGTYVDKDNNGSTNVGDVIKYHFEVINNGNVTVKEIRINDPKVTVTGGPVDLAPGNSDATTFSAEYVIKQEDIDRGGVYNLATAEGKDPDGDKVTVTSKDPNPISTDPGVDPGCLTCTITPLDRKGEITVMKTANLSQQFRYAGEKIEYDIVVSNTGNVTLKDVKVTDANADNKNIGTIAELKVGQSETFKAYHTITAADMLQGYVSNIAVAVGNDPKNNPVTGESKSGNPTQPKDPVDPNCKTCTITPLPWKEIKANNDTPPAINGKDGGSTTSVLDNDQLNGQPVVPAEVKLTPGTSPNKGITMNPDGTITVSPETPAGIYEYPYTICELLNPANCSDAKATVVVEAAVIKANNDTPPAINGKDGGSTTSVLDNDQLNGKPVVPAEVKLTPGTSPNKGITMNPDGTITVSPETPAGIYEYPYTICELLNPANCSDAKATVVVEAAPIKANNDTPPAINGKDGGSTTSVLDNDQLNGQPVVPAEVKLTPGTSPNKGITMNPDGTITISPETPAGIYEYPYTICEVLNPANCSDAKVTVVVEAAVIKANNDTPPAINGKDGGSTTSVLDNDQLNGKPVVPTEVKLTPGTSPNKGITMNPDGTITVSPETPAGIYEYPYTICEVLNPANCSDAKVTVVVEAAVIKANNDTPPAINGKDGGSTTSVLDNDQLNGKPVVPAEVKLTPGTSPNKGITMNPDGTVTISPETPAGVYEYPYTICELLN